MWVAPESGRVHGLACGGRNPRFDAISVQLSTFVLRSGTIRTDSPCGLRKPSRATKKPPRGRLRFAWVDDPFRPTPPAFAESPHSSRAILQSPLARARSASRSTYSGICHGQHRQVELYVSRAGLTFLLAFSFQFSPSGDGRKKAATPLRGLRPKENVSRIPGRVKNFLSDRQDFSSRSVCSAHRVREYPGR